MPYELTWEDRGVYRRYYGYTTDLDVRKSVYETHSSPRFDELRYTILDFLGISGYCVNNPSFIEETAAIESAAAMTNPNIMVAIVAVEPGILRMAADYSAHELTPYPVRMFANMDDARKWVAVHRPLKIRLHRMR